MPRLFSYGTLQDPAVQRATFGRLLDGGPDVLTGFALGRVPIADPALRASTGRTHFDNVTPGRPDDRVPGMVFAVSDAELAQADEYERDADFVRETVTLASGATAWVYRVRRGA